MTRLNCYKSQDQEMARIFNRTVLTRALINGFRQTRSNEIFSGSSGVLQKGRISSLRVLTGSNVQNERRYSVAAEAMRNSKPGKSISLNN